MTRRGKVPPQLGRKAAATSTTEVADGVIGEDYNLITRSQVAQLLLLPESAVKLWLTMAVEVGKTRRGWWVEGGMRELCERAGLSQRSGWRALPQLEAAGLVVVKKRTGPRGTDAEHKYVITRPRPDGQPHVVDRERKPGRRPTPPAQLSLGADLIHNPRASSDTGDTAQGCDAGVIAPAVTPGSQPQLPVDPPLGSSPRTPVGPMRENRRGRPRVIRLDGRPWDAEGATADVLVQLVDKARARQQVRLRGELTHVDERENTASLRASFKAFRDAASRWVDHRACDLLSYIPCPGSLLVLGFCDACGQVQSWAGPEDVCGNCGGDVDVRRSEAGVAVGLQLAGALDWSEGALVPPVGAMLDAAGVRRERHREAIAEWHRERLGSAAAALEAVSAPVADTGSGARRAG